MTWRLRVRVLRDFSEEVEHVSEEREQTRQEYATKCNCQCVANGYTHRIPQMPVGMKA